MKKELMLLAIAAAALPCLQGCGSAKSTEPVSSAALFEKFDYRGDDDQYRTALPDTRSYYNPVLPGWYSDPSICTNGEGDYFLCTSTFTYYPGVPLFHSRDLINWKPAGHILDRPSQMLNMEKQHVSGGIFAPDISYNPANKTYYMVTTNVGAGNFFVKTQDPYGDWSDPIPLPEIQGIDPAFFFDEDGRGYIVNNDDAPDGKAEYPGHRTVRVMEFDTASDRCIGERKIVVNKGVHPEDKPIWCEGPHIYKVGGKYYLMTAEGGTSTEHSEVIYRGDTPFGPYTAWDKNPILTQRTLPADRENPVTCAGHADLVKGPDGKWWSVFLACRPVADNKENLGRETFMLPVTWTEDGWPLILPQTENVPLMVGNAPGERSEGVTFGNFERNVEFTDSVLSHEWLTLRGPANEFYSLKECPGCLKLRCGDVRSTDKAVLPFVARRIQHHNFTATTRMTFLAEHEAQQAGLLVFKDETHQYLLARAKKGDGNVIVLRKISESGSENLAAVPIETDNATVDLRVEGKGLTYAFSFSTDRGATWSKVGEGVDAGFTSTAVAGGFTGTVVGMYAGNNEPTDKEPRALAKATITTK